MIKIYKFGGSSLDSYEKIKNIAQQIKKREVNIIVVSAIGNTTDKIKKAISGLEGDPFSIYKELQEDISLDSKTERKCNAIYKQFRKFLYSYKHVKSSLLEAALLVCGERLAAEFIKVAFQNEGMEVESMDFYDKEFPLIVEGTPLNASINLKLSRQRAEKLNLDKIIILPGFAGVDLEGNIRTLGRGGSDLAAMGYGYAFKAKEIWICTDVEGVKSAPPKIVKEAKTLPRISIEEAMDAAFFGAKLPSTRTLEPLAKLYKEGFEPKCIIASSQNLEGEKTEIVRETLGEHMIIAGRDVVRFSTKERNLHSIISQLIERNLDFFLIGTNRYFDLFIPEEFSNIIDLREGENLYLAGVISSAIRAKRGVSARASAALNNAGVNILYNVDPSKISMGFIIEKKEREACIRALYSTFCDQ